MNNEDFEYLNQIPKQNNFKIPAGYFEELASTLENKLEVKNQPVKKGIVRTLVLNLSIAAAVVIGVFLFKPTETSLFEDMALLEVEITSDQLVESILESSDFEHPIESLIVFEEVSSQVEVLYESSSSVDEMTSEQLGDLFEEGWEDSDYEF